MIFVKLHLIQLYFHGTNKFPAAKYSIVGNYFTQKAPLREDRIQMKIIG